MSVGDGLRIALMALTANKLRTFLTLVGIIFGVAAVICTISIGKGSEQQVTNQFSRLGTNILYVRPGSTQAGAVRSSAGSAPTLTMEDGIAIAENVPNVIAVAPETTLTSAQILAQGQNLSTRIVGTTPTFQDIRDFRPATGDFFTDTDVSNARQVIVLGANVATNLFGDLDPVGQNVRVSTGRTGVPFQVVGVMQAKGGTGFLNQDDQAFIPVTTLARKFQFQRSARGGLQVSQLDVQVTDIKLMAPTVTEVSAFLRQRHRVQQDDFTIQNPQDLIQQRQAAQAVFTLLLSFAAGISLVVGGIGIMNIMLVSVTERTREIGIRKAVGARRKDIMMQFLIESVTVSFFGGLLGVAVGVGLSELVDGKVLGGQTLVTIVQSNSIIVAFAVSALIGLFFGIYPATRASRLNPIQALRYE